MDIVHITIKILNCGNMDIVHITSKIFKKDKKIYINRKIQIKRPKIIFGTLFIVIWTK